MILDIFAYAMIGIPLFLILVGYVNKDAEDRGILRALCSAIIFAIMILTLATPFIWALIRIFGGSLNES